MSSAPPKTNPAHVLWVISGVLGLYSLIGLWHKAKDDNTLKKADAREIVKPAIDKTYLVENKDALLKVTQYADGSRDTATYTLK